MHGLLLRGQGTCAARATHTHTGGVDVEASLQYVSLRSSAGTTVSSIWLRHGSSCRAGCCLENYHYYFYFRLDNMCRCMLIAVGSDESAASLVVVWFGALDLLSYY